MLRKRGVKWNFTFAIYRLHKRGNDSKGKKCSIILSVWQPDAVLEKHNAVRLMQFTFTTVLQRKTMFTVSVEICFKTSFGIAKKKWRVRNRKKRSFSICAEVYNLLG